MKQIKSTLIVSMAICAPLLAHAGIDLKQIVKESIKNKGETTSNQPSTSGSVSSTNSSTSGTVPVNAGSQLKANDIAGLILGMSVEEVRASLKAHNPAMQVVDEAQWKAAPGVPVSLAKISGCVPYNGPLANDPGGPRCLDRIEVTIGHMQKKALFIARIIKLGTSLLMQNALDSTIEKYGTPPYRSREPSGEQLVWSYTLNGVPLNSLQCAVSAYTDPADLSRRDSDCSLGLNVSIIQGTGNFASKIALSLYDYRLWAEEQNLFNAAVKAHQQGLERDAQGNKIKL